MKMNNRKLRKIKQPILKSTGKVEYFSANKLRKSIERTGLKPKYCKEIAKEISHKIKPGTSTKDIFNTAIKLVQQKSTKAAVYYSLKKALLDLGPTGYEFEYYVARYFEDIGYKTFVGITLQGQFVRHEVDVVASKTNYQIYVECKFHSNARKNDIKTVLYVKARWDDLKNGPDGKYLREFYLVSNTAFTSDAIDYAHGVGLNLLGVNAPEGKSFLDIIRTRKLFPITSIRRLKKTIRLQLLSKKIIMCKDLLNEKSLLLKLGMTSPEIDLLFIDINKIIGES